MEDYKMTKDICPACGQGLYDYSKYLYCYRCSKQYKRKFFGKGLKEVTNTIQKDQQKAMRR
jgi:hypothetical protein